MTKWLRVLLSAFVCLLLGYGSIQAAEEVQTKEQATEEKGKFRVAVGDLVISPSISPSSAKTIANSSLMADIENALRNGRKFEVLTRRASAMSAIRKEQQLAESNLAAGDAAETGQISNAQAIVNVEVLSFSFGRSAQAIPNMDNKWSVSDSSGLELSVQIIDTRTTSILASFPIKSSSSSGSSIVNRVGGASGGVMDATLSKAATTLANMVADSIFPIQVLSVKDKRIWVNRGDDSGMKIGDIFEVFEPGEEMIDPQTGESLGATEMEAGRAKITRVNPKVSVMDMISGDASQVKAGFILRRPVKK